MRASYPDTEGYVEREGVRLFYEVYEGPEPTLLLFYPFAIGHSRGWKGQIPYLARHFRVVTFDQRGSGRSDRPRGVDAYRLDEHAADALAVLDGTGTERAVLVTQAIGAKTLLLLCAEQPERVRGAAFIAPYVALTPWSPVAVMRRTFEEPRADRRARRMVAGVIRALPHLIRSPSYRRFARTVSFPEGLRMYNRHFWLRDQRAFLEWFYATIVHNDPHSTKQIEDAVEWGMETDARTLADSWSALDVAPGAHLKARADVLACCDRVRCPVLVIHGEHDIASPPEWGRALAEATGGRFLGVPGFGHAVAGRRPVTVNLALREFAERCRSSTASPEQALAAR